MIPRGRSALLLSGSGPVVWFGPSGVGPLSVSIRFDPAPPRRLIRFGPTLPFEPVLGRSAWPLVSILFPSVPLCPPFVPPCPTYERGRRLSAAPLFLCPGEVVLSYYLTRSVRPMRRIVVDLMPFRRQMFETVVP